MHPLGHHWRTGVHRLHFVQVYSCALEPLCAGKLCIEAGGGGRGGRGKMGGEKDGLFGGMRGKVKVGG